jgi:hypothetical protein
LFRYVRQLKSGYVRQLEGLVFDKKKIFLFSLFFLKQESHKTRRRGIEIEIGRTGKHSDSFSLPQAQSKVDCFAYVDGVIRNLTLIDLDLLIVVEVVQVIAPAGTRELGIKEKSVTSGKGCGKGSRTSVQNIKGVYQLFAITDYIFLGINSDVSCFNVKSEIAFSETFCERSDPVFVVGDSVFVVGDSVVDVAELRVVIVEPVAVGIGDSPSFVEIRFDS